MKSLSGGDDKLGAPAMGVVLVPLLISLLYLGNEGQKRFEYYEKKYGKVDTVAKQNWINYKVAVDLDLPWPKTEPPNPYKKGKGKTKSKTKRKASKKKTSRKKTTKKSTAKKRRRRAAKPKPKPEDYGRVWTGSKWIWTS